MKELKIIALTEKGENEIKKQLGEKLSIKQRMYFKLLKMKKEVINDKPYTVFVGIDAPKIESYLDKEAFSNVICESLGALEKGKDYYIKGG